MNLVYIWHVSISRTRQLPYPQPCPLSSVKGTDLELSMPAKSDLNLYHTSAKHVRRYRRYVLYKHMP